MQGPVVDVPVPANSPGAGRATTIVVPLPSAGGWGGPAPAPAGAARPPALPPAPSLAAPLPLSPLPYRVKPQRSLSDMANDQLRRDKKGPLEGGVEDASVDDCMHAPKGDQAVGGLLAAPALALRALTGKCAK
ncbi:MAG: hypothetical protein H7255_12115 [Ramlibacter sp.]|nr:hypothetical protein [Ramlibacter sp.]